ARTHATSVPQLDAGPKRRQGASRHARSSMRTAAKCDADAIPAVVSASSLEQPYSRTLDIARRSLARVVGGGPPEAQQCATQRHPIVGLQPHGVSIEKSEGDSVRFAFEDARGCARIRMVSWLLAERSWKFARISLTHSIS